MTIFLCGFMGCGKTTSGKLAAKKLGCGFCDTDDLIVRTLDMSIPEIFEKKGEPFFRSTEAGIVRSLCGKTVVAACGGGAMLDPDTAEAAAKSGSMVIFLDVPFEECYERISGDKNRPIAANSTKEQLRELWNNRRSTYMKHATVTLDCCKCTPAKTAEMIVNAVKEQEGKR